MEIKIIGLSTIPLIKEGDDLANIIIEASKREDKKIEDGDIIVIAETIVSKAEGNKINLKGIKPTPAAKRLAEQTGKDPRLVEAILRESKDIIKVGHDFIISETKHGFICANAGIDESNVEEGMATPLPEDPDATAENIRSSLIDKLGKDIIVIIADTQGRPFREGAVGVAVGVSGMSPIWDRRGETDLYGKSLKTTKIAVADEIASAASMVMGQANEGIPIVIIKGYPHNHLKAEGTSKDLLRPKELDVFR
ncbi:F420-0--gamma-glutamyl ligase [Methanothermobacter tenebrarum]|uniref:Coenzyme F420:L-glutamate ligase n=1 Tax=Methanothermobacter tenebrarum TaxID=680118 RepID=A0ABM7YCR6_9EURY|nr:F420-0--gamma-glutamyl ligase [Methanothermobacter tenebrarum]